MNGTSLPGDVEDVEFNIEKEQWNTYELKDGVKIRGRIIVLRFIKDKVAAPGQYGIQSQNIFVTYAPQNMKGTPATPPLVQNIKPSEMYAVDVENSNEVWNIYKIPRTGDTLKVKLVATEVLRVKDAFDQSGQPYYVITSGLMIAPVSKGISS